MRTLLAFIEYFGEGFASFCVLLVIPALIVRWEQEPKQRPKTDIERLIEDSLLDQIMNAIKR